MRSLTQTMVFLMIVILASIPGFAQVTYTWNGGDFLWSDTTAWTPNGVPGAVDTAIVNSGKVTVDGDTTVARLQMEGGILFGAAKLSVTGAMIWSGGSLEGAGVSPLAANPLEIAPGAVLEISGNSAKNIIGQALVNKGSAAWTGAGNIILQNNAVLENQTGATFDIQNNALMDFLAPGGTFNNAGILTKSAGGSSTFSVSFKNTGTVNVNSGIILLTGGGSGGGTFNIAAGSILEYGGGTHILDNVTYLGGGKVETTDGTVQFGGLGASFSAATTFDKSKGNLISHGPITLNGPFIWSRGTISGTGTFTALGSLEMTGNRTKTLDGVTLNNQNSGSWSGNGRLIFTNNSVFNNSTGATFDIENGMPLEFDAPGGVFNNAGTLSKIAGNDTTTFDIPLNNSGALNVNSGRMVFNNGSEHTGGPITLAAGSKLVLPVGNHNFGATVSLQGAGDLLINGGTVNFDGSATLGGMLNLNSGVFNGSGNITVNGPFNWNGGGISGSGSITAASSLNLVSNSIMNLDGRTLISQGAATWSGPGNIRLSGNAELVNAAGTTFDIQTDGIIDVTVPGEGSFTNAGILTKSAGAGTAVLDVDFNNSGMVNINSGTLQLKMQSANTGGAFNIAAGNKLLISGGNHSFNAGTSLTGPGNITISGGTVNFDGSYGNSGTLQISGGTFSGNSDLALNGPVNWSGGTIGGSGNFIAANSLSINGNVLKTLTGRTLINQGAATWSGTGGLRLGGGAEIINQASATFNIQNNAQMDVTFPGQGRFNNFGTLAKNAGVGISTLALEVENNGILDILSGILKFGFIFSNKPAGIIRGNKTLDVTSAVFTNNGAVNPGASTGILTVNGSYPQSGTGTLNIEIGGTVIGGGFDRLAITNTAQLNGTLDVSLVNNFEPAAGDTFEIVTYAARAGAFSTVNIPIVDGQPVFEYYYSPNSLILKTIGDTTGTSTGNGAVNDTVETFEEVAIDINVLENDGDPNGSNISIISFSNPFRGTATFLGDSTIKYTPFTNFSGADSFFYVIANEAGIRDTANVYITVLPVNDPPAISPAIPDITFPEDGSYPLNLNAYVTDIDNVPGDMTWTATVLSAQNFPEALAGSAKDSKSGAPPVEVDPLDLQVNINPATNIATFTASGDSSGIFTVEFVVTDPGGASDKDTLTVNVTPVNDPPALSLPDISFPEDSSYTLNLDSYVSDPEHNTNELNWSAIVIAAQGNPGDNGDSKKGPGYIEVDPSDLQVFIDPSTRVATFNISGDSSGVFTVVFSASDPQGAAGTDTMLATVTAVNDAPFLANPVADAEYAEDSGPHTAVPDLNTVFSDPDPGTVFIFSAISDNVNIQLSIQGDSLTLNSSPDYFGSGNIAVTAEDGNGAAAGDTFQVNITPVNDPPAASLVDISFPEDSSYTLDLDQHVIDVDNDTSELNWTAEVIAASAGPIDIDLSDLQITIDTLTHVAAFSVSNDSAGVFTVTFTVSDPGGLSNTDTMLVNITPVNDSPQVINPIGDVSYPEDSGVHTVVGNLNTVFFDPDPATTLIFSAAPDNPDIQISVQGDSLTVGSSPDYFGSANVVVAADDGNGGIATDTFQVVITAVNDLPVINGLPDSLWFETDSSASLTLWDFVEDIETPDSLLTFEFTVSNDSLLYSYNNATGILTLSAIPGFIGNTLLVIEVTDESSATVEDSMIVSVNPLVGISDPFSGQVPREFTLEQNYPNPFNPNTTITFQIATAGEVKLTVYNLLGQKVRTLVNGYKQPGYYKTTWDGYNDQGFPMASGVYIYRLWVSTPSGEAGNFRQVMKMILLR